MCTPFNFEIFAKDKKGVSLLPLIENDAPPLYAAIRESGAHLTQYGDRTWAKYRTLESVFELTHFDRDDRTHYGIWDGETLVGYIAIRLIPDEPPIIGYWVGVNFTRRGYAAAAVRALTDEAFREYAPEVLAVVHPDNAASRKTLLRAGFLPDRCPQYDAIPGVPQMCFSRKARQEAVPG